MRKDFIEQHGPLAAARTSSHLTQSDMAKILGLSAQTISKYENDPTRATYRVLRGYLDNVGVEGKEIMQQYMGISSCNKV